MRRGHPGDGSKCFDAALVAAEAIVAMIARMSRPPQPGGGGGGGGPPARAGAAPPPVAAGMGRRSSRGGPIVLVVGQVVDPGVPLKVRKVGMRNAQERGGGHGSLNDPRGGREESRG